MAYCEHKISDQQEMSGAMEIAAEGQDTIRWRYMTEGNFLLKLRSLQELNLIKMTTRIAINI